MPVFLTVLIAKLILVASRALKRGGGSALPGLVAEKIDPQILSKLGRNLKVVLVTGTNGKTTTVKMLQSITADSGLRVLTNPSGSNLTRGIVSRLIEVSNYGKVPYDLAIFEVDEASMPETARQLQPASIVVLNLFRDQLDRYGELDKTASLIGQAIAASPGASIFLNADDPLVASLNQYADRPRVKYFGVQAAGIKKLQHDLAADSDHCPFCGQALEYTKEFFGHLGHYSCPQGHFDRPGTEAALTAISNLGISGSKLEAEVSGVNVKFEMALPGLYNAYNALAALQVADYLSISVGEAVEALKKVEAAFGRVESFAYKGRTVYMLLIKNPTGFNQVIQTFLLGHKQALMIAINDNFADGRDVSWLWDVAFEELGQLGHQIVTSGIRAADMSLRLKYAEVKTADSEEDLERAFDKVVESTREGETIYVLPTYTAMLSLRGSLAQKAELKGFWQ